jgi:rhamnopyranosyl-N-acetylglucosaminyl-diphospho-decaprenol beta-1,3/1,4-galactofuranosyltransferase
MRGSPCPASSPHRYSHPMNKNTVAVIVTFNRLQALKLTMENTFKQSFYKIIVVNNVSTDGTGEWLNTLDEDRLIIIHSEKNQGGAGGFHQGFRYAAEQLPEAEWLLCYDDDAYPEHGVMERFQAMDIPPDVGGVAGAVYLPSGQISEMNRPSKNPFWHLNEFISAAVSGRHGFHVNDECFDLEAPMEIDASSFVGFFLRLSLIRERKIGLPISELFIYADDIIYVLEMRKAGFRHLFMPTLEFYHDCQTLIEQRDVYHPLWKVYYVFRNRLEMYRVASGIFYPFILLVKIPKCFWTAWHYVPAERKQFLRITAKAIWDGVRRNYSKTHAQVVEISRPPA